MDTIELVQLVLILIAALLMLINIWLYFNGVDDDTISYVLKTWAYDKYFFLTFAWGVLGGHFFLGVEQSILGSSLWVPPIIVLIIMGGLLFLGLKNKGRVKIRPIHQFALLVCGFLFGHFFWSQRLLEEILKTTA